jgi:hypothetical protein
MQKSGRKPDSDNPGGLKGSMQHPPEVLSEGISTANSFAGADSKKTLPCVGFIEYSPKDQIWLKSTIRSTD